MQRKTKLILKNYFTAITLLMSIFFWSFSVDAENSQRDLDQLQQEIIKIQKLANIPALGVVLIDNGEAVWITSLGTANLADNTAINQHSLFRIGSISKMLIGLAVLKLVEEGRLSLDDKVRDLVPDITFENKWHATHPVLLAHLLEHTSGWGDLTLAEFAHNETKPIALKKALMLFPNARKSRWPAGTRHAYSGVGTAVASYIVEKTAGMPFEDYISKNFFIPLGMDNSTYFKPDSNKVMTTTYILDEAQDYESLIYRPIGAINTSPADMANFLGFLLQQGEFSGSKLMSKASFQRMKTPKTTLGSALGITAGYGITNYSSGYGTYNTAFHGHDGAINGATASLAYVPKLNSGYVIMSSGNGAAMYQIAKLIREYIVRDVKPYDTTLEELPNAFKHIAGYYKKVNPRNNLEDIFNDLFNFRVFSFDNNNLYISPILGGKSSSAYSINEILLANPNNGLSSIALVNDPLLGQAIQVDMNLYVAVSQMSVWSKILLVTTVLTLTTGTILFTMFWSLLNYYRKTLSQQQITCRLWPCFTSISLVAFISSLVLADANLDAISKVSALSLTILTLSLCYPIVTITSLFRLWKMKSSKEKSIGYWLSSSICIIHLINVILLASYGMIGFRIWLLYHI